MRYRVTIIKVMIVVIILSIVLIRVDIFKDVSLGILGSALISLIICTQEYIDIKKRRIFDYYTLLTRVYKEIEIFSNISNKEEMAEKFSGIYNNIEGILSELGALYSDFKCICDIHGIRQLLYQIYYEILYIGTLMIEYSININGHELKKIMDLSTVVGNNLDIFRYNIYIIGDLNHSKLKKKYKFNKERHILASFKIENEHMSSIITEIDIKTSTNPIFNTKDINCTALEVDYLEENKYICRYIGDKYATTYKIKTYASMKELTEDMLDLDIDKHIRKKKIDMNDLITMRYARINTFITGDASI